MNGYNRAARGLPGMEAKVIHREFAYLSSLGGVFLSQQHKNAKNYLNCGELSGECSSLFVHTISPKEDAKPQLSPEMERKNRKTLFESTPVVPT